MSEKNTELKKNRIIDWNSAAFGIVVGVCGALGVFIIGGLSFNWSFWPEGFFADLTVKDWSEIGRNLGLIPIAMVGLWLAYLRTRHLDKQHEQTERGQITDRYTKAVQMLGNNDNLSIRVGALNALKQIALDAPDYRLVVKEVIENYVRRPPAYALQFQQNKERLNKAKTSKYKINTIKDIWLNHLIDCQDIHIALHTLTEIRENNEEVDISGAHWSFFDLSSTKLEHANLSRAQLVGADLSRSEVKSTSMSNTNLSAANLGFAIMHKVDMSGADLSDSDMIGTDLRGANIEGANVSNAFIGGTAIEFEMLSKSWA